MGDFLTRRSGATFSGTVNAAGKVSITLVSLGGGVQTAGETTHITGTLNKKTDIMTGGFTVSDGAVGTYQAWSASSPFSFPGRVLGGNWTPVVPNWSAENRAATVRERPFGNRIPKVAP